MFMIIFVVAVMMLPVTLFTTTSVGSALSRC